MSALFEIAYLSVHELFMRLEKVGGGEALRGRGRRTYKKYTLEILRVGDAFNVNASNSAQE